MELQCSDMELPSVSHYPVLSNLDTHHTCTAIFLHVTCIITDPNCIVCSTHMHKQ